MNARKIIWSIDPFERESETRARVVKLLSDMGRKTGWKVEPVFVLGPESVELSDEFSGTKVRRYLPAAKKLLTRIVSQEKLLHRVEPVVLLSNEPTLSTQAEKLARYAQNHSAPLIVVSSHSKKGIDRILLGSFAETLLLESHRPVLVIPHSTPRIPITKLIYSSDLGPGSEKSFKKCVQFAKTIQAELILFHALTHPVNQLIQEGVFLFSGSILSLPEYMSNKEMIKRKIAEKYSKEAKKQGVSCKVVIAEAPHGVIDSLLHAARAQRAQIIAISSRSGRLRKALVGSITQKLVRSSKLPVWIDLS